MTGWWLPLILGFTGSLHCVLMCGPLQVVNKTIKQMTAFHAARISVYAVLGFIAVSVGLGIRWIWFEQTVSVISGSLMLASVPIMAIQGKSTFNGWHGQLLMKISSRVYTNLNKEQSWYNLALGAVNGLLPCGILYLALGVSATQETFFGGGLFMALFGVGTLPAVLFVGWFHDFSRTRMSSFFGGFRQVLTAAIAVLLILRGLNLNLPFVSPYFAEKIKTMADITVCGF